jgi:hypothetical protein
MRHKDTNDHFLVEEAAEHTRHAIYKLAPLAYPFLALGRHLFLTVSAEIWPIRAGAKSVSDINDSDNRRQASVYLFPWKTRSHQLGNANDADTHLVLM